MNEFLYLDEDLKQFAYYIMDGRLDYSSSIDEIRAVMLISYFRASFIYNAMHTITQRRSVIEYIAYLEDLNSRRTHDN